MDQARDVSLASKPPKAIIIVGGSGQNVYLCDCLRELVDIEVLQSSNG